MGHRIRLCDGSDWEIQAEILSRQYHLVTECTGFGGRTELKLQFFFFETMWFWESYCTPSAKVVFFLILSLIPFCLIVIFPHLLLLCFQTKLFAYSLYFCTFILGLFLSNNLTGCFGFGPVLKSQS